MPRRKLRLVEKPWIRDPAVVKRWQEIIDEGRRLKGKSTPAEPSKGWELWDWRTLEDVPQD
jgi:hypothetical protein